MQRIPSEVSVGIFTWLTVSPRCDSDATIFSQFYPRGCIFDFLLEVNDRANSGWGREIAIQRNASTFAELLAIEELRRNCTTNRSHEKSCLLQHDQYQQHQKYNSQPNTVPSSVSTSQTNLLSATLLCIQSLFPTSHTSDDEVTVTDYLSASLRFTSRQSCQFCLRVWMFGQVFATLPL